MSLSSCKFLEVERIGKTDIPTFFSDPSSAESSMNGVYNRLYSVYNDYLLIYPEVAADHLVVSASEKDWQRFANFESTYMDETTPVGYIWQKGYDVIANTNQILNWVPQLKESYPTYASTIDNVVAQAYFVRALMHFELCCVYAQNYSYTADASHLGVPVITWIPAVYDKIARSTVSEVYAQVISDLNSALSSFTENYSKNGYYASPLACKALLARVYLYKRDYENAVKYATEVIEATSLTPRDSYVKMFRSKDELGDENIFRLNGYDMSKTMSKFYHYTSPKAVPSKKLKSLYTNSSDVRLNLFEVDITDSNSKTTTHYSNTFTKYLCTDDIDESKQHYNPFVLRASEMYLIRAEANCALGNLSAAEDDVKALEARALGCDASAVSLGSWSDAKELDSLIMEERQKELCLEGHRFFDLARRHEGVSRADDTTSSLKRLNYPDYRYVLAIPYIELTVNSEMVPNPSSNWPVL